MASVLAYESPDLVWVSGDWVAGYAYGWTDGGIIEFYFLILIFPRLRRILSLKFSYGALC